MTKRDKDAVLGAAAKTLAWELYSRAGYCRTRSRVNVERFDRELRAAAAEWRKTQQNLTKERSTNARNNA